MLSVVSDTRDEILALERRRCDALVECDSSALADLIGDDYVYVHSNGDVDDRASYLRLFESGKLRYSRFEHQDVRVRQFGPTAVINAVTTLDVPIGDGARTINVRSSMVWARSRDAWKQVLWHATIVPQRND
jgi:ketosteroid isomerase-like protein